jgi:DNA-3-methyladenine glycosylase
MKVVPLPPDFFQPSAQHVAPRLLGHWLLRRTGQGFAGGMIVETEAYLVADPACHSYGGKTKRNQAMWGPPGHAYVYFIYGNHFCVNAVCRPHGFAEAVLIRAIEPFWNLVWMQSNRPDVSLRNLSNGPGKLCSALAITREMDAANLCHPQSPLFIGCNPDAQVQADNGGIVATTRIGITKAADLPLRFYLENNPFVSQKAKIYLPRSSRTGMAMDL